LNRSAISFSEVIPNVQISLQNVEKFSEFATNESFANRKRLNFVEENVAHAKLQVLLMKIFASSLWNGRAFYGRFTLSLISKDGSAVFVVKMNLRKSKPPLEWGINRNCLLGVTWAANPTPSKAKWWSMIPHTT